MLQELNIHALWAAAQVARGTPLDAADFVHRFRAVGGGWPAIARADGSQRVSNLGKFGDATDWVQSLSGAGSPPVEATPEELAWWFWAFEGGEVASAVGQIASTATTVNATPNLTLVNPTTGWQNGMPVAGAGIPAGTIILSGAGTANMVMSKNATASAAGVAITGNPAKTRHRFTPIPGVGKFIGLRGRVGSSQITRQQFNDMLVSQLVLEGSTANQALRVTPTTLAVDPAVVKGADPAQALPTKRPYLHGEGVGRYEIDNVVFRGHSQFTLTLNLDLQPVYGDDNRIYDFAIGNAGVTIGVTVFLDAEGIPQWNRAVYGEGSPPADARPMTRLPALGSYAYDLRALNPDTGATNGDTARLDVPGVKWNVPDRPPPNPEGGPAELAFTGEMRVVSGQPEYQLDVECDAAAFTA